MATDEGLFYDTIAGFSKWVSNNTAAIFTSDIPNDYTLDSDGEDLIKEALLNAEGEVDGYIKQRGYAVPIDKTKFPRSRDVLVIYVRNIAVYELFGRRGISKEQYYKYTKTIEMLKKFGSGKKTLPDDPPFKNKSKLSLGNNLESVFSESTKLARHSI